MKIVKTVAAVSVVGMLGAGYSSSAETHQPNPDVHKRIAVDYNPAPQRAFDSVDCHLNPDGAVSFTDHDPLDVDVLTPRSLGLIDYVQPNGTTVYALGATLLQLGDLQYEVATSNTLPGESTTINLATGAFSRLIEDEKGEVDGVLTARLQDGAAVFRIDCISQTGNPSAQGLIGPV